jgi:hypothetical protein
LAILGLLALLGLLTGLYFLFKAIGSGHSGVDKPEDIDWKSNATSNSTNGTGGVNGTGPAVIDSNSNPNVIRPSSSNTTILVPVTPTGPVTSISDTSLLSRDPTAALLDKYIRSQDITRLGPTPLL